ncbi:hypothetical protein IQ241_17330 [Romeria aff. gracilis LEGE 07310]|uniref:Uncharacterized protein n=1 Tax=Vasconcelosia minhoensis LEGE 07310 TaxID=915328 RepID=A0A8J7AX52_9CYAN|nr:hypothetical protein [Romeria gracilis]MBE9079038.1 hypothetical protein [Romeria aff. gracilis LEGE 07310]
MTDNPAINLEEQLLLRINREMGIQLDAVIKKVQDLAKKFSIDSDQEKSPFKNVLSAATENYTSLEVIKNFIRYQAGRQPSNIWKKQGFAKALVQDIDGLSNDVNDILDRISKKLDEDHPLAKHIVDNRDSISRSLHLQLTQLYLGYLSREHTARLGEESNNSHSNSASTAEKPKTNRPNRNPNRE